MADLEAADARVTESESVSRDYGVPTVNLLSGYLTKEGGGDEIRCTANMGMPWAAQAKTRSGSAFLYNLTE
jgi:hypothetical protein